MQYDGIWQSFERILSCATIGKIAQPYDIMFVGYRIEFFDMLNPKVEMSKFQLIVSITF